MNAKVERAWEVRCSEGLPGVELDALALGPGSSSREEPGKDIG